jgi:hypothetical protein
VEENRDRVALETGGADVVQIDGGRRGRSAGGRVRLRLTFDVVPGPCDGQAGEDCGDGDEADTECTNSDLPWWRRDSGDLPMWSIGRMHALLERRASPVSGSGALPARGGTSTFIAAMPTDLEGAR